MTEATWNIVKRAICRLENPPAWLDDIGQRSCAEIDTLPKLDDTVEGQMAFPVIEEKVVTSDYLDFLREQIQLNARGSEWTNVLQKRLKSLQPFLGKTLITVHFFQKPSSINLRVNPENGELIYAEFY